MVVSMIIILGLLLILVAIAVIMLYKENKNGGNYCSGCPYKGRCMDDNCQNEEDYDDCE